MDYLTRLFLELEETEKQETVLPEVTEVLRQTATGRAGQLETSTPDAFAANKMTGAFPARQLSRLLETAQKAQQAQNAQQTAARSTVSAGGEQAVPLSFANGTALPSQQFSLETGEALTPERFSRFFERDSRRY